jgi:hypothetical protein
VVGLLDDLDRDIEGDEGANLKSGEREINWSHPADLPLPRPYYPRGCNNREVEVEEFVEGFGAESVLDFDNNDRRSIGLRIRPDYDAVGLAEADTGIRAGQVIAEPRGRQILGAVKLRQILLCPSLV